MIHQQSERVLIVNGQELIWRTRHGGKWVGVFGPDDVVHFMQPPGCHWRAQRPYALEPICTAKSLFDCVKTIQDIIERRRAKTRKRLIHLINCEDNHVAIR